MLKAFACSEIRFDGPRAVTNARADSVHNTIESAVPLFSAERIASWRFFHFYIKKKTKFQKYMPNREIFKNGCLSPL